MENLTWLFSSLALAVIGVLLGYFARQTIAKKQVGSAEAKADKIISEAKTEAKEEIIRVNDKAVEILEEAKKEEKERRNQLLRLEQRSEKKEENLDRQNRELEKNQNLLREKAEKVRDIKTELEDLRKKQLVNLEKQAKLSQTEAKQVLLQQTEEEMRDELAKKIRHLENEEKEELGKKARDIMTLAMQRYAASQAQETTASTVSLPNDELKGRIIGREGRNIKTLEKLTGVEVIVDDTPEAIVISSFDPIRRQVAKMSLERLMVDGRIHPARIEEAVEEAKKELAVKIKEAGDSAVYELGVAGFDPKLIQLLGRLCFRTSFGQNVLMHSLEVAYLASALASELGADANLCKKAGLLHDIGKAVDHEVQGTHVEIGRSILKKFNLPEEIIRAMQSHHEEYPFESSEAMIVQVADAISASRPGARKDTLENYLKRLEELEKVANSFPEVEKSYAIQAGREIRIFVTPEKIDDLGTIKLSRKIAQKIEDELKYPGEIKVNIIREMRAVDYAR